MNNVYKWLGIYAIKKGLYEVYLNFEIGLYILMSSIYINYSNSSMDLYFIYIHNLFIFYFLFY